MRQFIDIINETHDYNPEWDYEVVDEPEHAKEIVEAVKARVHAELMPRLGMSGMKVFFAADLDGALARYVYGTSSFPVLGVDFAALTRACEEHELEVEQQLAATIAHELAHAYQERIGTLNDDEDHDEDGVEDEAETFARRWVMDGVVDVSILE